MMTMIKSFIEAIAWLKIALAPIIASIIIAGFMYIYSQNITGLLLAIFIIIAGIVAGITWAQRVRKKYGLVDFISKVNASPELDNKEQRK